jgi:tetratricopeptide (TPR) repeat protein
MVKWRHRESRGAYVSESMSLKAALEKAMQLQLEGKLADAELIYTGILKDKPEQPDSIHLLGLIRSEQERDNEAVVLMERALELYPQASHFHHNIAGVYRRMGRLGDAEREFRAAIERKPDYGEAYQGLAEMVKFKADDPLIEMIQAQLEREELDDRLRSYFHFAAGKICDDVGQYKAAFKHYAQGNRLAKRKFDSNGFRGQVKDALYVYNKGLQKLNAGAGLASEVPTFIIGMPRSGTTLIEQILASHSQVFGAGELNDMKAIAALASQASAFKVEYPNCIPGIPKAQYTLLGEEYLRRVRQIAGDKVTRIVDKHPLNFQYVGLIFSMFPNARIIHTVRNPLDTCLSCFFQNFSKGQDYSFDLKTLGHFYNDYRRLMEHWETIYPDRIYTISYGDVVSNQKEETIKLLEFMGLEFEDSCIDFHKTQRKVNTASFLQVRMPIYSSSRRRWVNYVDELQELGRIIGVSVQQPVTISGGPSKLS